MPGERSIAPDQPVRKIPRSEWTRIAARHAAGEALASIARDYRCTPPAIRYIVRRGAESGSTPAATGLHRERSGRHEERTGRPLAARAEGTERLDSAEIQAETPNLWRPDLGSKPVDFDFRLCDVMTLEVSAFLVA